MTQNAQFLITIGTIMVGFLCLRNDIKRLDAKIDRMNDTLQAAIQSLRGEVATIGRDLASIRESQAWRHGRLDNARPIAIDDQDN